MLQSKTLKRDLHAQAHTFFYPFVDCMSQIVIFEVKIILVWPWNMDELEIEFFFVKMQEIISSGDFIIRAFHKMLT